MTQAPLIVRPADHPQPLNVLDTSVTVLADNAEIGDLGVTLQHGAEGSGPSAHCHPWDEAFYILEGSVEFAIGGGTTLLEAGSLVVIPGNTVHAFHYGPGGGKMLEMTGRGSKSAAMFGAFDREMPGEPDLSKVIEIFGRHDVKLMA
jgi:quercetin dioxygenase-like cupin family protein